MGCEDSELEACSLQGCLGLQCYCSLYTAEEQPPELAAVYVRHSSVGSLWTAECDDIGRSTVMHAHWQQYSKRTQPLPTTRRAHPSTLRRVELVRAAKTGLRQDG